MSVAKGTVHSIQFLRFVAATVVVVYHAFVGYAQLPIGVDPGAGYWLRFGAVGVHLFFVISGYIMYLTNFGRPVPFRPGRFLLRRMIRVYPVYWTFVALYLVLEAAMGILPVLSGGRFAGMIALLPADSPRVIGPAWTLSFEIYFYLLFGVVMMLGERKGLAALTALFVASVGLGAMLHPRSSLILLATNTLLLEFLGGAWVAWLTATMAWPRWLGWLALAAAAAGFAAGLSWGYERMPSVVAWGVPSTLLIAAAVILEQTNRSSRRGVIRRTSWLGDSSYSLYLGHTLAVTLVIALVRLSGWRPSLTLLIALTTLGCVVAAIWFYRLIEAPMIWALHRWTTPPGSSSRQA